VTSIETKYGTLGPVDHVKYEANGQAVFAVPAGPIHLDTPLGRLTTQHTTDDMRRPKVEPLLFHPNGALKSIALETRTTVDTPLGPMAAELLSFYPCGSLRRVFPLNGKLSGYWSEKEEATLTAPMTIATPAGTITAMLVGVQFHPGGQLRSVTLWPGEAVEIDTPIGRQTARIGVAFHKSGRLRSFEPERMLTVPTALGDMMAYDPDALGIHGDLGSLRFHEDGSTAGLATPMNTLEVTLPDGSVRTFTPEKVPNLCDERVMNTKPLWIGFYPGRISVGDECPESFPLAGHQFKVGRMLQDIFAPIGYACGSTF